MATTSKVEPVEEVVAPIPTRHDNLADALAAFQAELPPIKKGNTAAGKNFSYTYADLADVSEAALPLLGKHGLAWSAKPTMVGNDFVLHYKLMHGASSEVDEGIWPIPGGGSMQDVGSTITYIRRYALCAVTGIAPGGDDNDAASLPATADRPQQQRPQRPQVTPEQPPIAAPVLSQDWFALAKPSRDRVELRKVYDQAEQAGELGLTMPLLSVEQLAEVGIEADGPVSATVEALLRRMREVLPATYVEPDEPSETPNDPVYEPVQESGETAVWPVVQIPTSEGGEPS